MKPFLTPDTSTGLFPSTLVKTGVKAGTRLVAASAFGAVSFGMVLLGAKSAAAAPDYFGCTAGMVGAGVAQESAIAACASARYPEALAACVVDVSEFTGLTSESALIVCGRSRRPVEVANCTIGIHDSLLESPSTKVLENCGRSLLPERYSNCVVDISDATDTTVDNALDQCIRAGFRPWRIQPTL
ncbi:MAG: hypothetical protein WA949_20705 [Phormidesmis sp.]